MFKGEYLYEMFRKPINVVITTVIITTANVRIVPFFLFLWKTLLLTSLFDSFPFQGMIEDWGFSSTLKTGIATRVALSSK